MERTLQKIPSRTGIGQVLENPVFGTHCSDNCLEEAVTEPGIFCHCQTEVEDTLSESLVVREHFLWSYQEVPPETQC